MGYVYLMLSVSDTGTEAYKIGVTKNDPIKRLKQLSTGNDNKITLVDSYQSDNYLKVERSLHRKYRTLTEAKNEWRKLSNDELSSFIKDCEEADETINFLLKNNPFYN